MSVYTDIYTVAINPDHTLRQKVAVAIMANALITIPNENPSTPSHDARVVWARRIKSSLTGPQDMAAAMIWSVIGDQPRTT